MTTLPKSETATPRLTSAVIDEAMAGGPPKRIEDLERLNAELRAHIKALLPQAERSVDALWRGDVVWSRRRTDLDAIKRLLENDLGNGLQSATHHVQSLARVCRRLLSYTGGDQ